MATATFLILCVLISTALGHEVTKRYYGDCEFNYVNPDEEWPNLACDNQCDPSYYYVQSPVAIKSEQHDKDLLPLPFEGHYNFSGQLFNNGHTATLLFPENYTGGFGRYKLEQIHFHTAAENLDLGFKELHEMEIHLVHIDRNRNNRRVVVAIFGDKDVGEEEGQTHWFNAFIEAMPLVKEHNSSTPITLNGLNNTLANLRKDKRDGYWTFMGSLTTPPCTEGVQWYVMKTVLKVNATVLETFRSVLPLNHNNRPVQRNVERVQYFDPKWEEPPNSYAAIAATLALVIAILGIPFGIVTYREHQKRAAAAPVPENI